MARKKKRQRKRAAEIWLGIKKKRQLIREREMPGLAHIEGTLNAISSRVDDIWDYLKGRR